MQTAWRLSVGGPCGRLERVEPAQEERDYRVDLRRDVVFCLRRGSAVGLLRQDGPVVDRKPLVEAFLGFPVRTM
jgi:hypothetical protein